MTQIIQIKSDWLSIETYGFGDSPLKSPHLLRETLRFFSMQNPTGSTITGQSTQNCLSHKGRLWLSSRLSRLVTKWLEGFDKSHKSN